MPRDIDISRLVPADKVSGEDGTDTSLLRQMSEEAKTYLLSFEWCKAIRKQWFGWGVGGIAAVFLIEFDPATPDVDEILWVIVGDLPPAYLVIDESPTPLVALKTYVDLMQQWVDAVRAGESIEDCIPVNNAPTRESADALEMRLTFLRRKFLANGNAE